MCGGDRGIVLLVFASLVCQNAFLETLWSRAVPFCLIKVHSKTTEEIFQWIATAMVEVTSLVMSAPSFIEFPLVGKRVLLGEMNSPD